MCSRRCQAISSADRRNDKEPETYVDLGDGLLHNLLTSVVDQDVESSMFTNMFRNQLLAILGIHDIESKSHTFLTILFDSLLDSFGTAHQLCSKGLDRSSLLFLLLREIANSDVCAFSGKHLGGCSTNSGITYMSAIVQQYNNRDKAYLR